MANDTKKKTTRKVTATSTPKKNTTKKATPKKVAASKTTVKKTASKTPVTKVSTTKSKSKANAVKESASKEIKIAEVKKVKKAVDKNKTTVKRSEPKKKVEKVEVVNKEEKEAKTVPVVKEEVKTEVKKEYAEGSTILGLDLPLGNTKEEKAIRASQYAKDATIFAIIIPILDLFAMLFIEAYKAYNITNSEPVNYCLTMLVDFALIFILTYLIDYIHGENLVKKFNK